MLYNKSRSPCHDTGVTFGMGVKGFYYYFLHYVGMKCDWCVLVSLFSLSRFIVFGFLIPLSHHISFSLWLILPVLINSLNLTYYLWSALAFKPETWHDRPLYTLNAWVVLSIKKKRIKVGVSLTKNLHSWIFAEALWKRERRENFDSTVRFAVESGSSFRSIEFSTSHGHP